MIVNQDAKVPQPRTDSGRFIPLGETQRGLWALGALNPDAFKAYHESMTFLMSGPYDHSAMTRCFQTVIDHHEALRTWIADDSDSQFIADSIIAQLPLIDFAEVEPEERENAARVLLTKKASEPFVARTPMVRGVVAEVNAEKHYLTLTFHHLLGNGPSYSAFVRELFDLYDGKQIESETMQLAEFIHLQPSLEQPDDEKFWRDQFQETVLPLELPLDYLRPVLRSFRGDRASIVLDEETFAQFRKMAASQRSSLFMALFAAFTTLLHRISGQDDLVVGVPFESRIRDYPGGRALFANTTNVVPLRSRILNNPTFAEYLRGVKQRILAAAEHQEYFFARLLSHLDLAQDPARPPLFSVIFNFEESEFEREANGLQLRLLTEAYPYRGPLDTAMFDLCINVTERSGKLEIQCDFCKDLFGLARVERWLGHYRTLLLGLIADPEASLLEVAIIDPDEWHQIVVNWNETQRSYRTDLLLHQFFEKQVESTPNAVALIFGAESLPYAELNRRANQLAHALITKGVGPEKIVGILANRSFEMVIAILAVLKAGGAYLPLSVSDPQERIAFVIEDAEPTVVLASSALNGSLPVGLPVISLENDFSSQPSTNPAVMARPETTAYVIYTSGSTGRPKGVLNTHGGVANWLWWMIELFPLQPEDSMVQKTPYTFDVSVRELFLPLATGARLVIAEPELHGDSRYLAALIKQNKITAIHFVPPLLSAFLDEPYVENSVSSLKWVICSGDVLTLSIQEQFFLKLPKVSLFNLWGATETAPETSSWKCRPDSKMKFVPIGNPGANTQIYILDQGLKAVPIGVTGEIYVGGVQVAKGYLKRPELTKERFIPNPFGKGPLYRTGDLARFLPDGVIEFLGRIDHQVKLRGFRIELGEIETILRAHPAVKDCAILVRGREESTKRLVGYVVATNVEAEGLQAYAAEFLPDYMVPASFMFLTELPITSNGKLNKEALPDPVIDRQTYLPPRNEIEIAIAKIWQETLQLSQISVTDNFFELGGNSLLALRIFYRIKIELGSNLPMAFLLKAPSIEKLALKVKEAAAEEDWKPVVAIQSSGNRPPFFGIHGVNGNILFYLQLSAILGMDQPFYALQAQGLDGRVITRTTVEQMSAFYLDEIRQVQPHGPYFLGGYSFGGLAAYEIAQNLRAIGEEVALLILFDTYNPAKPPRFISPWAKLIERIKDPDGVDFNRLAHFLASHTRGPLRSRILSWNEQIQRKFVGSRKDDEEVYKQIEVHLQTVYANAFFEYKPLPYQGKMTILRASQRPAGYQEVEDLGWKDLVSGGIEIRRVPGSHANLFSKENVSELAKQLQECLDAARRTQVVGEASRAGGAR